MLSLQSGGPNCKSQSDKECYIIISFKLLLWQQFNYFIVNDFSPPPKVTQGKEHVAKSVATINARIPDARKNVHGQEFVHEKGYVVYH